MEPKYATTSMLKRFSLWVRFFLLWIFKRVLCDKAQLEILTNSTNNTPRIYLLETENKYDFLYLNYLCLQHNAPIAYWSNGKTTWKYGPLRLKLKALFTKTKQANDTKYLESLLVNNKAILIYLNPKKNKDQCPALINTILQIQKEHKLEIQWISTLVLWERLSDSMQKSLFNEIYGTPTKPSSLRRFLSVLPTIAHIFFKIGSPITLINNIQLSQEDIPENIINNIQQAFDREREIVVGPKLKPWSVLKEEIFNETSFLDEIKNIHPIDNYAYNARIKQASKYLDKIAARFSFLIVKLMCTFLTPIWSLIYNGLYVDADELNEIRKLSRKYRVIFLPSHKSHVDYLILSYLLYQNGFIPPHITAGENLDFFPIGRMLRGGGAFFIKRSFKGDQLYSLCLQKYIEKLLLESFPIEFFIEGGRSRTGQVLQPKYGILKMIAQSALNHPEIPIKLIPCAITYEKVIEDMAYTDEQLGGEKSKENFTNLIKTTKILISKYGQIYLSFGQPLDLHDALEQSYKDKKINKSILNKNIEELASNIMLNITKASTITSSAILSTALLNANKNKISNDELSIETAFYLDLLWLKKARLSPPLHFEMKKLSKTSPEHQQNELQIISDAIQPIYSETIKLLQKKSNIYLKKENNTSIILIPNEQRLQLTFYKNSMLHAIIEEICLATAALAEDSHKINILKQNAYAIAILFDTEFIPPKPDSAYQDALKIFFQKQWLIPKDNDEYEINPDHIHQLQQLRNCLEHFAESYHLAFKNYDCLEHNYQIDQNDFITSCLQVAKTKLQNQTLKYPEAISKLAFQNAITKLKRANALKITNNETAKKSIKLIKKLTNTPINFHNIINKFFKTL